MARRWLIALAATGFIALYLLWQNNHLTVTNYNVTTHDEELEGVRIVQLADLHHKSFGEDQLRLEEKVLGLEPDLIVLTGDMVDGDVTDVETHLAFLGNLIDEAPIYAVSGNHEHTSDKMDDVRKVFDDLGVVLLENESRRVNVEDTSLELHGVSDPVSFKSEEAYPEALPDASDDAFDILLVHRPAYFDAYSDKDYDLVLSAHAHGGMFRLPFYGGIYAPDQGFFPAYTEGPYTEKGTTMILSRGLGNSVIPFRIMNRPDIVLITLKS